MLPDLREVHQAQPKPQKQGSGRWKLEAAETASLLDIVGGMDSLPLTQRGHRYILTMIDCFTRFAVAVPLVDQSAEVVIASVLGSYITVYGTPRRILTDQGRNFESDQFAQFCNLFRISKIRTTSYHPQSNGICERFNQTLKHTLTKILSQEQQTSWDLYLGFAVFSYNLSVHSSTGFTPFFLTFGSEARLPPDIVFGAPAAVPLATSAHGVLASARTSGTPLSLLLKSFSILARTFASVRENLRAFHQREKDRYDLGAVERVFKVGDQVRVRIKSRQKGPSKFQSHWSGVHEVLRVRGVVVTVRELSTGREYNTHHDRLSNPLFSHQTRVPEAQPEHERNANPSENPQEPEGESEPRGNPEEALIRTRSGRVVRPPRRSDFDYSFVLPQPRVLCTPARTCTSASATVQTSAHSMRCSPLTSLSVSAHDLLRSFRTMPLVQEMLLAKLSIYEGTVNTSTSILNSEGKEKATESEPMETARPPPQIAWTTGVTRSTSATATATSTPSSRSG